MGDQEETTQQLVVARVGEILCGIDIDAVHEIILMQEITDVRNSPCNVLGVINVRGAVLPVADLRACLGIARAPFTPDTRIILVSYHDHRIGLVVDGVAEVITLRQEAFQSIRGSAGESPFLRPVARLDDRLILDIDHTRVIEEGLERASSDASPLLNATGAELAAGSPAEDDGGVNAQLLETSFAVLEPKGEELSERFFEAAPPVEAILTDDATGRSEELVRALSSIASSASEPEKLTEFVEGLGERGISYGALEPRHDAAGEVLLASMAEIAGDAWTDELQTAWSAAFAAVKQTMLAGPERIQTAA